MTASDTILDSVFSVRGNPIRRLIICGALLIFAIAIGTGLMVSNFRERALRSSERELENTVLLLARQIDQQLDDFEVVAIGLIGQERLADLTSPEAFKVKMSTAEMHFALRAKVSGTSDVAGVNIFDSGGTLINSSELWPVPAINIADRDYFKAFKTSSSLTPVLIEPVQSRLSGGWTAVVSRKITGPNEEFLGLITRGIRPIQFENYFASLALGKGASIALSHQDGTLLARYPHVESMIGRNFSASPVHQQLLSKVDHGLMRAKSPVDGQDRLVAARRLDHYPLSIVATTTVAAALTDWQEQTRFFTGAAGLSVLVIVAMLFLIVRQLSRQHRFSQQRLTLEKQRLDTAVNNMTQGLLLFDASERLIVCNRRYVEMYGLSPDRVKPGCTFREIIAYRKETGSFVGDVDAYCSLVSRDSTLTKVSSVETSDGRSIQVTNQPVVTGGRVVTHEDVTERKLAEEQITHLAHYDGLTDLPNRALFHERLEQELTRLPRGEQLAILYMDIDEFKSVNDSLGHLVGDELLKAVALRLRGCVDVTNFVARLGGDEFAIVQTAVKDPANVTDLVRQIYHTIREPYDCLGHQVTTDASIGIVLAPQDGTDLDQLLKKADLAMYRAKGDGRRTYRFFEPDMERRVEARRSLEIDLRQAIAAGDFEVYYQPFISLRDAKITGCEALLRWRHHKRGMVSPAEFIPIAEETGLITQLGEWVLMTACAEAATWPDNVKLAVNVSPVQFRSHTLALKVAAALATSGLAPNRLELEITEAVLMRHDDAALAILQQLRAMGVKIALDDFGTGYSSLSYLQRYPFDKIKIDRCFVSDIAEAGGSSCIVQAVVNIAAARNMTTTAEGVETEQQRDILRTLGCAEMQGYLFSQAIPAIDMRRLLSSHRKKIAAAA